MNYQDMQTTTTIDLQLTFVSKCIISAINVIFLLLLERSEVMIMNMSIRANDSASVVTCSIWST